MQTVFGQMWVLQCPSSVPILSYGVVLVREQGKLLVTPLQYRLTGLVRAT